ncbi:MAG: DNA primase [Actinobacteria bacterium]|nr:DNA primase [Actinomycetota bacterium]
MGILDEDVARVRESTDIVGLISQYTQLKRVGQRWSGLCPFHAEKTPSFSVNDSEGLYHCFGCRASGDAITFVREIEHVDFVSAVEVLAGRCGITLRYSDSEEHEGRRRHARLLELMERAVEWYHDRLRTAPDAGAARRYLRHRGFDSDEVARYRLGWAPDDWDRLVRGLGAPAEDLEAAGLGFTNRAGRLQDFFRARILFPIDDERGRPIGFGGRKLPGTEGAKYQNSRDNVLYNKSKALYGLDRAKTGIVQANEVVVCEGYTDVVGFDRADIGRAVATCGTSLTEDHVRALKRFSRRIVLAYDADEAGQAAAERVYAWEQAHEISVFVVHLPPGADPDELARSDPQRLRSSVVDARPFLSFRVERVMSAADLDSPEGRARAADAALVVVAEHPDELVRDQYVMDLADRCRVPPDQMRARLEQVRRAPRPSGDADRRSRGLDEAERPVSGVGRLPELHDGVESEALRLRLHHPEVAAGALDARMFSHALAAAAYRAVEAWGSPAAAVDHVPPEVAEVLARLAVEPLEIDPTDVLARFAGEVGRRTLADLEAEARSSMDPLAFAEVVSWLKVTLDHLRRPNVDVDTLMELVAFLRAEVVQTDAESSGNVSSGTAPEPVAETSDVGELE